MNFELRQLYDEPDLVATIKCGRLRYVGHLSCMKETRQPKQMLNARVGGRRPRGSVAKDANAIGHANWKRAASDR